MSDDPVHVALLRGVNVGARRKLPMADLRAILTALGCEAVRTHIQSGNAVFRAPPGVWGVRIAQAIGARFPFTPQVMVVTRPAFDSIVSANPFADKDPGRVQIGVLGAPSATDPAALSALAAPDESLALTEAAFYLHAPSGIGRSVLASRAERLLDVPMTMRNARVAAAIAALAHEV